MNIKLNQGKGDSPISYDLTDLDYDMLIIILQGLRKKKRKVAQKKATARLTKFETFDMDVRSQFNDQVQFLEELEAKLGKSINQIVTIAGFTDV